MLQRHTRSKHVHAIGAIVSMGGRKWRVDGCGMRTYRLRRPDAIQEDAMAQYVLAWDEDQERRWGAVNGNDWDVASLPAL